MIKNTFYSVGGYLTTGSGRYTKNFTPIGRLNNETGTWTKVGQLLTARYGGSATFDGTSLLVIGGVGTVPIEKCDFFHEYLVCKSQAQKTTGYYYNPPLFFVQNEFSTCKKPILKQG